MTQLPLKWAIGRVLILVIVIYPTCLLVPTKDMPLAYSKAAAASWCSSMALSTSINSSNIFGETIWNANDIFNFQLQLLHGRQILSTQRNANGKRSIESRSIKQQNNPSVSTLIHVLILCFWHASLVVAHLVSSCLSGLHCIQTQWSNEELSWRCNALYSKNAKKYPGTVSLHHSILTSFKSFPVETKLPDSEGGAIAAAPATIQTITLTRFTITSTQHSTTASRVSNRQSTHTCHLDFSNMSIGANQRCAFGIL